MDTKRNVETIVSSTPISSQNMISPKVVRIIRLALAFLIVITIVYRIAFSWNKDIPVLIYFTVQSNLACAALWFIKGFGPKIKIPQVSFYITTYIAITGAVFLFVLDRGFTTIIYEKLESGSIEDYVHYYALMVSMVAHYIVPLLAVMDFLLFTDNKAIRIEGKVLIYPLCYLGMALLFTWKSGKYVYPFLDPDFVGGSAVVALIAVGLLLVFLLVHKGLYLWNRKVQKGIENYYKKLSLGT